MFRQFEIPVAGQHLHTLSDLSSTLCCLIAATSVYCPEAISMIAIDQSGELLKVARLEILLEKVTSFNSSAIGALRLLPDWALGDFHLYVGKYSPSSFSSSDGTANTGFHVLIDGIKLRQVGHD